MQQLRFVVLLGAISIIGIISVQSYFLFKSWNIREKQMTQSLMIALKSVAENLCRLNQIAVPPGNPVRQLTSNRSVIRMPFPVTSTNGPVPSNRMRAVSEDILDFSSISLVRSNILSSNQSRTPGTDSTEPIIRRSRAVVIRPLPRLFVPTSQVLYSSNMEDTSRQ